jgi:hypothetical protein
MSSMEDNDPQCAAREPRPIYFGSFALLPGRLLRFGFRVSFSTGRFLFLYYVRIVN